jgi:hypothetical protein
VIAEYQRDRDAHPTAHLMIRNTEICGWDARQIAGDSGLDIATFDVTDGEFEEIAARCFDWPADKWSLPPPEKHRGDRGVTSNSLVLTSCGPDELEVQVRRPDLRPICR